MHVHTSRRVAALVVPAPLALVVLALSALVDVAPTQRALADGSILDVEVANRTKFKGRLQERDELESVRLRVPAGALLALNVSAPRGPGAVSSRAEVFRPDGSPFPAADVRASGNRLRINKYSVVDGGLYRVDLTTRSAGVNYVVQFAWEWPKRLDFTNEVQPGELTIPFPASAGTRMKAFVAVSKASGAEVTLLSIDGPGGYHLDFPPATASRRARSSTLTLPEAGEYLLRVAVSGSAAAVSTKLQLKLPRSLRRATQLDERQRLNRYVSRRIGCEGGEVDVEDLAERQNVTTDISGTCVRVPEGALSVPSSVSAATGPPFSDPTGLMTEAGTSIQFATNTQFATASTNEIPYDVGDVPDSSDVCVLTLSDDGTTSLVPGPYTVDQNSGTIGFAASHYSSFKAFQPARELAVVATADDFASPYGINSLGHAVAGGDGALYVANAGEIDRFDPATGQVTRFLGATDYDFDYEYFEGIDRTEFQNEGWITRLASGPGGELVFASEHLTTVDFEFQYMTTIHVITAAGKVFALGGIEPEYFGDIRSEDFVTPDGGVARDVYIAGDPQGLGVNSRGDVYVLVEVAEFDLDTFLSDVRVWRIDRELGTIHAAIGFGSERREGIAPRELRLEVVAGSALVVDSEDRVLVGEADRIVRADFAADSTQTVAGNVKIDAEGGIETLYRPGPYAEGAPPRSARVRFVDVLAMDPQRPEFLYANSFTDPEGNVGETIWRFDLERNRAYILTGEDGRTPPTDAIDVGGVGGEPRPPRSTVAPVAAVVPIGDSVYIVERVFLLQEDIDFDNLEPDRIRVRRRRE